MFYCDECARERDWPRAGGARFALPASRGPCECCGRVRDCYDVPSLYLPLDAPTPSFAARLLHSLGLRR